MQVMEVLFLKLNQLKYDKHEGGMNNVEYLLCFWGSYVFIDPLFCFCVHTQKNDNPLSRLYPPDHLRIYVGFQPSNVATGLTRIGSILSKSSF